MNKETWKETTWWPPDIARNSGEKIEMIIGGEKMKCHRCNKELNDLTKNILIDKDGKLRCTHCDFILNKENTDEYIKITTEN